VTMVDAAHAADHLAQPEPVGVDNAAVAQITFADRIVINKTDLVTAAQLCDLAARIRAVNALAPIVTAEQANVDLDFLLGLEAFDLSRALSVDPQFLTDSEHRHDESISSVGLDLTGELHPDRVESWLRELLTEHGRDIFRCKGTLALAGQPSSWVFQGVHALLDTERGRAWAPQEPRRSRLVFIGRNLDRDLLDDGFRSCLTGVR
jgi:G3E family GTPase